MTDDLREALTYEWEKLTLDYIRILISSMPSRVKQLRRLKGRESEY